MFPALVGMNRLNLMYTNELKDVPRTRGDEPPPEWIEALAEHMFPALVGMNRSFSNV